MDAKNILGYIFSIAGIIGLFLSVVPQIKDKLFGFLPETASKIASGSLIVGSIIALGAGVFLLVLFARGSSKQKAKEVPIYKGKEIVGYRRMD